MNKNFIEYEHKIFLKAWIDTYTFPEKQFLGNFVFKPIECFASNMQNYLWTPISGETEDVFGFYAVRWTNFSTVLLY